MSNNFLNHWVFSITFYAEVFGFQVVLIEMHEGDFFFLKYQKWFSEIKLPLFLIKNLKYRSWGEGCGVRVCRVFVCFLFFSFAFLELFENLSKNNENENLTEKAHPN